MKTINSAASKRRTTLILIAIAFLLVSAIVYAALSGVLTISGTTTTQANTDVIFTNVTATTGTNNVEPEFEVSDDGHSIAFSADFTEPGQIMKLNYKIKNNGSTNATVYVPTFIYDSTKISVDGDSAGKLSLSDNYSALSNLFKSNGVGETFYWSGNTLGLQTSEMIQGETTDEYITLVPGGVIDALNASLSWPAQNTSLTSGEYEATLTLNYEMAT